MPSVCQEQSKPPNVGRVSSKYLHKFNEFYANNTTIKKPI